MLNKKQQDMARAIERARYRAPTGDAREAYLQGIHAVAHAIADDVCTAQERNHFLLVAGVPFER